MALIRVFIVLLLLSCDVGGAPPVSGTAEQWSRSPTSDGGTDDGCPNWDLAPAGKQWRARYYCDECNIVNSAGERTSSDPTIYWQKEHGLLCECITDSFQYNVDCPDQALLPATPAALSEAQP